MTQIMAVEWYSDVASIKQKTFENLNNNLNNLENDIEGRIKNENIISR